MSLNGSTYHRDFLEELGLDAESNVSLTSSSEEEICEALIPTAVPDDNQYTKLQQTLKQTQSELRAAQISLAQSEHGKENRLKILRKTHQSALSFKQSLIQELQDIVKEKDEYINQLEDRFTGREADIGKAEDNSLVKIVDRFSQLSKDHVDLLSKYEQVKEELNEAKEELNETKEELNEAKEEERERKRGDRRSMSQGSKFQPMIQEIKQLQGKVALLEKEHQENLSLKDTNQLLQTKTKELQSRLSQAEASLISLNHRKTTCDNCQQLTLQISALRTSLHLEGNRSSVQHQSQEYVALETECTRLKNKLEESREKEQQLNNNTFALERMLQAEKLSSLELSNKLQEMISQNNHTKLHDSIRPAIHEVSKLVEGLRSDLSFTATSVEGLAANLQDEFSQAMQKVCQAMYRIYEDSSVMRRRYLLEMKQRKKLHNALVELRGNIRVLCRVRPVIDEDGSEADACIAVNPDKEDDSIVHVQNRGNTKSFEVDKVFGPKSTQNEARQDYELLIRSFGEITPCATRLAACGTIVMVFDEVQPLITSCIDGFNVCIFAYGQTGSGKTFTMEGSVANPGINQRALSELFTKTKCSRSDWTYSIFVSMLEIYNESIHDLLSADTANKLDIKLKNDGYYVPGLTQVSVSDLDEINTVFSLGRKNRSTASTKMNISSSRSHALLCISVMGHNVINGVKTFGKLSLVDLAGSERLHKSGSDGARMQEAKHINKSLSSLADVIYNLRTKSKHIPYRNSKLTFLLQDSLGECAIYQPAIVVIDPLKVIVQGGDSKTLMIVQLSPVQKNSSETFCSLNFAQRVRAVELGAPTKNITKL